MATISADIDTSTNGYSFTGFNIHLTIKPGVSVTTYQGSSAIVVPSSAGFDWIDNSGILNGGNGIAAAGTQTYIVNESDGKITGYDGVSLVADSCQLENLGNIFGSSAGVNMQNSDGGYVDNFGTIDGGYGIFGYSVGTSSVFNSGVIAGQGDAINVLSGDHFKLTNTGAIHGDLALSATLSNVINRGEIDGDLTFGNGTNAYNGRAGTITGTISGGTGVDTIFAGNDGETIGGGGGHDKLYGGAGADRFVFASTLAADRDNVYGFNAASDTLVLDHAAFSHLTVGATPEFAISATPTTPTDDLFYNAATGGLYYDPDGSGSHSAALFAVLTPGLNLTAANFEVV